MRAGAGCRQDEGLRGLDRGRAVCQLAMMCGPASVTPATLPVQDMTLFGHESVMESARTTNLEDVERLLRIVWTRSVPRRAPSCSTS